MKSARRLLGCHRSSGASGGSLHGGASLKVEKAHSAERKKKGLENLKIK